MKPIFKTGDRVEVVSLIDDEANPDFLGKQGTVLRAVESDCGAAKQDPMFNILFAGLRVEQYWKEELKLVRS